MKLVDQHRPGVVHAWAGLAQTEEWRIIRTDLQRAIDEAYRDATARIDTAQRDWLAGRAAMLQELLDTLDKIRTEHHGRRMPPVVIAASDGLRA